MIKRLVFGVAAGAVALVPSSALAGPYVNPELNVGAGFDDGISGGSLELHGGYSFANGAYVQVGPALMFTTSDSEFEISGKAGQSWGPAYGEVSFMTGDELSIGFKAGAKWEF